MYHNSRPQHKSTQASVLKFCIYKTADDTQNKSEKYRTCKSQLFMFSKKVKSAKEYTSLRMEKG